MQRGRADRAARHTYGSRICEPLDRCILANNSAITMIPPGGMAMTIKGSIIAERINANGQRTDQVSAVVDMPEEKHMAAIR